MGTVCATKQDSTLVSNEFIKKYIPQNCVTQFKTKLAAAGSAFNISFIKANFDQYWPSDMEEIKTIVKEEREKQKQILIELLS
jgi:hypothetical protein